MAFNIIKALLSVEFSAQPVQPPVQDFEELTFLSKADGSTVALNGGDGWFTNLDSSGLMYRQSTNDEWSKYTPATSINLNNGDYVQFKNENTTFSLSGEQFQFEMTGVLEAYGDLQSLVNFSNSVGDYGYYNLFKNCTSLTKAPELSAIAIGNYSYSNMFYGCTNLIEAPELPATTLGNSAYEYMFSICRALTTAPELPATTLADNCYQYMFNGCTKLTEAPKLPATSLTRQCYYRMFGYTAITEAPELPATTLANTCYSEMFYGCTNLTKAPVLPATTLAYGVYYNMFRDCSALTEAPELPATALDYGFQYYRMFSGCSALTEAPKLPATALGSASYLGMFEFCTSLTKAPVLPATTLASSCYSEMFYGCTNLTKAPVLPATTLVSNCYQSMFSGCSALTEIDVDFTSWDDVSATTSWVYDVAGTGTFYKKSDLPEQWGTGGIPLGWNVVNKDAETETDLQFTLTGSKYSNDFYSLTSGFLNGTYTETEASKAARGESFENCTIVATQDGDSRNEIVLKIGDSTSEDFGVGVSLFTVSQTDLGTVYEVSGTFGYVFFAYMSDTDSIGLETNNSTLGSSAAFLRLQEQISGIY